MMARLLTEEAAAPSSPSPGGICETSKPQHLPARKLSFKTRQSSSSARTNYRATKVSLTSTNVALIASKFNTIVIDDGAQGRVLLKKLSGNQRKPSISKEVKSRPIKTRGEGVVRAAIEIFEHQDSEKTGNSKSSVTKGNDLRPKLVLVRKSSSKSSVRLDDFPTFDLSKTLDSLSKESAKDSKEVENIVDMKNHCESTDVKDIKRKPSLKAKPVIRHNLLIRQETQNALNQRIAKFNSIDKRTTITTETPLNQVRTSYLSLDERIAQFNKSRETNKLCDMKNNLPNMNNNIHKEKKKPFVHFDEKENKQEIANPISINMKNKKPSLVEQTKDRLATIIQQNSACYQNSSNSKTNSVKKQSLIKDKFLVKEKKELKVFQSVPDINTSAEAKDEDVNKRFSIPKDASLLENVFEDTTSQNSNSECTKLYESLNSLHRENHEPLGSSDVNDGLKSGRLQEMSATEYPEENKLKKSTLKDSLRPSIKPYSSESPKLEKKTLCVATDPSDSIQLDKIKPNNSFLWKPASRMSIVTEVPIYDDRPESQNSDTVFENDSFEKQNKENGIEEDYSKTTNSVDLDIASSFIMEMTEHIERRFSSGSAQEKDDKSFSTSLEDVNENVVLKNSSFLHGKSTHDDVNTSYTNFPVNNKPDLVKTIKIPPPVGRKPVRMATDDSPPQLPEKRPKVSGELVENLNSYPPPVPSTNTKPKLTNTPSEEIWLNNCKNILGIPPPLRRRNMEGSCIELSSDSTASPIRRIPVSEQCKINGDKRFSVSQVELLRRMSEMNLANKRNSLPSDSFSISSSYVEPEEDHYTSIQHFEKSELDDQDTYEAIGENNYAEIKEYEDNTEGEVDKRDVNNIYDDVLGQEQEDHYEAISCALAQGDSDSSCDQSNSLYGLTRPAVPGSVYQVTGGSETSDEWVDMENSDDQHESVIIFREKERSRGLMATESWSMKVRRQWSKKTTNGDDGSDESVPRSYENIDNVEEASYCDDFDDSLSDSSFDQEAVNPHVQVVEEEKRTQLLSEGIYGFMKQAGQRMRKHWSLGKSLTRMRKNKSTSSVQNTAFLGRRGWSFKSSDKPSMAQSTFYLHATNTLSRTDSQPYMESRPDPRRLSTTSMLARPTSPPPPPPPRNSIDESSKRKSDLNSSNNSSGDNEGYIEGQRRLSHNGNSMWYIETSTDSASDHGSSQGSDLNLRFADEPLYQFYAANIAEMTLSELTEDAEADGYEEITPSECPRPSALDLVSVAHHRSLWCEVPQVRNSGVLNTLSQTQKRLQEAKFEVMTSEASYFKSLTVLDKLFASCPLFSDENILARDDRRVLFGNVSSVRKCSEKLLAALQTCWQECILLQGICDVVFDHVKTFREVYVRYCTNQISMDRTLKLLKQTNSNFNTVLAQLEKDPDCQSLTLYSFLMLPMQRITRLRLLFDTMLSLLEPKDSEFAACQRTLDTLNKCVTECNEGARLQERLEEMVKLSKQLEFPPEVRIPILGQGSNRWLVRSGQVTQVNMDAKQTFGRRLSRTGPKFILFLFTDLFLITKKKSEESYLVVDHCQRSLVEIHELRDFPGNNRFLLQVTLLENADNKTVEMTLSCDSETERQRWLQVMSPPQSEEPGETLYEGWDCPQVTTIHSYQPAQPDELSLVLGDVVNVLRKSEGWFFGERTRDGEKGWFPGNYTREIASKHVRARNLRQRHRLLQLSADLIQQQRKIKS